MAAKGAARASTDPAGPGPRGAARPSPTSGALGLRAPPLAVEFGAAADDDDAVLGPPRAPPSAEGWCNARESMPLQETSHASHAAGQLLLRQTCVPAVAGMERESRMHNYAPTGGGGGGPALMRVAVVPQTALAQDMHAACHRLTVLELVGGTARLERAEECELQAAALGRASPDGALPPRAAAVTVLVNTTATPNAHALLDAAAHLARAPSRDDPPERAAQSVRLALLAQEGARAYAGHHAPNALSTRSASLRGGTEVCLSWAEPVPDAADKGEWRMRSEFAELKYCESADAYARELLGAVLRLWASSGFLPRRSRLFGSYEHNDSAAGAYVRGMVECADDFWSQLRITGPVRLSEHACCEGNEYAGLEFTDQFVRVSPKSLGANLGHPTVFPALLLHQRGWEEQSREFCDAVKAAEYRQAAAHGQRIAAYSLRRPESSAEEAVCLHLLLVQADRVQMGASLSPYGLVGVPGKSLSRNEGNALPRILRRIVPLDDEVLRDHFVLPCSQNVCSPTGVAQWQPLWSAVDEAVREYAAYFADHDEDGNPLSPKHSFEALRAAATPPPRSPARALTAPEADTNVLLGMPLGCPAIRLGDAYNQVRTRCGPASPVAGLLLAASGELGTEDSVVDAVAHATEVLVAHKDRARNDAAQIADLKRQLEDADADARAAAAAKRPRGDGPPPPPIDLHVLERLWRGLEREYKAGRHDRLPDGPIRGTAVGQVVRMFEMGCGLAPDSLKSSTRKWGVKRFRTPGPANYTDLQAIADLVAHAIEQTDAALRLILAFVEADGAVGLYEIKSDAVPRGVDAGAVLVDPRFETTLFWTWQAEDRTIFEYSAAEAAA